MIHNIDVAILKTVIYGDIFHFPMTEEEIHHFLIHDEQVEFAVIKERLEFSSFLASSLCFDGTYYALATRPDIFTLRHDREKMMQQLAGRVKTYGRLLMYFPFVEFVGVTGALSMRNPSTDEDDLDYLVVTRPGRVWLARACIILLVRIMRLRKIEICPNYVLASDQLKQARQDLYIAHEIAQLLPLAQTTLYEQLRNQNRWTEDHLANANLPFHELSDSSLSRVGLMLKRGVELVLSTRIGDWVEQWEFRRKSQRFQQQATAPSASAEIDEGHVKGHFQDYGHYVLEQYEKQLLAFQLDEAVTEMKSVGD